MNPNPYAPPEARIADPVEQGAGDILLLNRIASGQRLLVVAVLVSFVSSAFPDSGVGAIVAIVSGIIAIVGAVRLSAALGNPVWARVVSGLLMIVPLANLITMLVLSSRATRRLRAGGYRVGLLGAKQKTVVS
jgi:hypothetical protein